MVGDLDGLQCTWARLVSFTDVGMGVGLCHSHLHGEVFLEGG